MNTVAARSYSSTNRRGAQVRSESFVAAGSDCHLDLVAQFAFLYGVLLFSINKPLNAHRVKSRGEVLRCARLCATPLFAKQAAQPRPFEFGSLFWKVVKLFRPCRGSNLDHR